MRFENLNIVLIEDDLNVKMTIKYMLEEMDVRKVIDFNDPLEALRFLDEDINTIDMILCDWNMPQKSGLELLREIRQVKPKIPFVMVTARADKSSVMLAKSEKITSYISKPVTFEELKTKIRMIMEK